jgi:hypothetical protein
VWKRVDVFRRDIEADNLFLVMLLQFQVIDMRWTLGLSDPPGGIESDEVRAGILYWRGDHAQPQQRVDKHQRCQGRDDKDAAEVDFFQERTVG